MTNKYFSFETDNKEIKFNLSNYLRTNNIYFETSGIIGDMVHYEIAATPKQAKAIDNFIDNIGKEIVIFKTGNIKKASSDSLVDYTAPGAFSRDGVIIGCTIGYMDIGNHIEAYSIFIDDQIDTHGNHTYAETIFLDNSPAYTAYETIIEKGV